jgi:hypothetical protein
MSEKKETLEDRLNQWLETQGYPLEMAVAAAFQRAGYRVFQSDYYLDPESSDFRQVDVVARCQRDIEGILVRMTFAIECKLSRDKPWILFTSPQAVLAARASVAQRAASSIGQTLLWKLAPRAEIQDLPLLRLGNRCAYGMTQAFTSGEDVSLSASMSVAKAADARAREATQATGVQGYFGEIIFPVIIIDGKLFECYLNADSEQMLQEVSQGVLVWRNQMVGMPHTIIHVVTLAGLDDFIAQAAHTVAAIFKGCEQEIEKLEGDQEEKGRLLAGRRSRNQAPPA